MPMPDEWLKMSPVDLMCQIVSGEPGSMDVEAAKAILGLRYQEERRDLAIAQTNSAKMMEEAAKTQVGVNGETLAVIKHQAAIAKEALQDNKRMIRYTMWVAIATAAAGIVTLITQVALVVLALKK